jgi:hypothetical protein
MTTRRLAEILAGWVVVTAVGSCAMHSCARIDPADAPPAEVQAWAHDFLHAARLGETPPPPPAAAREVPVNAPMFVIAWVDGVPFARYVTDGAWELSVALEAAAAALSEDSTLAATSAWRAPRAAPDRVRFTIEIVSGEGPILVGVPYVESLGLVPMHEGLHLELDDHDAWVTPEELLASGFYDGGVATPIPDLRFGVLVDQLIGRLARELGFDEQDARDRGDVTRFRTHSLREAPYPREVEVTEEALRTAAREGAAFLLRHQRENGQFTYVYDARTGRSRDEPYNMPRHAGTAYFLAQIHNLAGMPEAREGAMRALRWAATAHARRCGGPDKWCIESFGRVDMGSSALAALAAAEVLAGGDDSAIRDMLEGLTAFIRSQQRPDGELMHEYDLEAQAPIDVQHLYYSGEAAFALLRAHAVLGDDRDLEVARGVMGHLTGAAWSFLGSRYYYGEEHWTCIAAGEASDRIDVTEALDFCRRWAAFNRVVQFEEGETPWPATGGYGVGPLLLPRTTPVASRSEAFVSTYEMSVAAGIEDPALRGQIEAGLAMLLRYRWAPGPVHLFAIPEGAAGGIPGSPSELIVRNDYVQHACSVMIRWAEILRRERVGIP